jgi:catechol 2,3-dioxygenase-like lactoylglutathione lyase family enzyme
LIYRNFLKRMKGLEPSTFCMARRRREWTVVDRKDGYGPVMPFSSGLSRQE